MINPIFFQLISSENSYGGSYSSTLYAADGHCYFEKCKFSRIASLNNGGGIAITGSINSVFILDSIFDECSALEGGAIYSDSKISISRFKVFRTCISKCTATKSSNAIYSNVYSVFENGIHFTSIVLSGVDSSNGGNTVTLSDGTVKVQNANVSQCNGPVSVAFYLLGKGQNLLHYSTVVNNNAGGYCTIMFSASRMEITNINFVGNAQQSNTTGLISCQTDKGGFIQNSNFFSNSADYILSSDKEISLYNINADIFTYTGNGFVTENVKTNQVFSTFKLEHYGDGSCHADNRVFRSDALRIAGYSMIGVFVLLFIVLIIVWCVTGRSRMKEVVIEDLDENNV